MTAAARITHHDFAATLLNLARPKPRIHVIQRRFADGEQKSITVLVDGEIYVVDQYQIKALDDGETPEDLGLDAETGDDL